MNLCNLLSHRNNIFILVVLTLLTFGNVLTHGFVGDDEIVIVQNDFYKSLANLPHLFSKSYISQSDDYFTGKQTFFSSGSVSYRPVVSVSYFLDYHFWKLHPFGYHLTSFLLHLFNVILVYLLLKEFFPQGKTALLAAILFSVHPLRAEVVAGIGYRHDLLACFFTVLAMLFYIEFSKRPRVILLVCSLLAYFLGLFAKEAALGLPVLIVVYDLMLKNKSWRQIGDSFMANYLPYIVVTGFYLWVYIFVFPNSVVSANPIIGGHPLIHIAAIFKIFFIYFVSFLWPLGVTVLPPLYAPAVGSVYELQVIGGFFVFLLCVGALFYFLKRNKSVFFFLGWFLIFYIPVSNLIPLANPMAHRFTYLPSIGWFVVFVFVLERLCSFLNEKLQSPFIVKSIVIGYVAGCVIIAMMLSYSWKSNAMLAFGWVKQYPYDAKGYSVLGIEYYRYGNCAKARECFLKNIALGATDHRSYYYVGVCSGGRLDEQEYYYKKVIAMSPSFSPAYLSLGYAYYEHQKYLQALEPLMVAVRMDPTFNSYKYLLLSELALNQRENAIKTLEDAEQKLHDPKDLSALKAIYEQGQ